MSNPTSTTSSRKRKADALESADDGESSSGRKLKVGTTTKPSAAAHLPASCLAAILNFMEYAEVRRVLLAGKIMAVDAARHVETLNIMNASELVPSAAGRFANVTDVHILSLEDGNEDILSADTAARSVPFLMTFPKLTHAFIGGIWRDPELEQWKKFPYTEHNCIEPKDHLSVFRGLVDYLSGAFRSRSLSPSLHLKGIVEEDQMECRGDEDKDGHRCRHCWNIVSSFPLDFVLKKIPVYYGFGLCLNYSERIEALAARHDNPLLFQPQAVIKCFLTMINNMFTFGHLFSRRDGGRKNSFIERINSQGGRIQTVENTPGIYVMAFTFFFIPVKYMEALKRCLTVIGPSVMTLFQSVTFSPP